MIRKQWGNPKYLVFSVRIPQTLKKVLQNLLNAFKFWEWVKIVKESKPRD